MRQSGPDQTVVKMCNLVCFWGLLEPQNLTSDMNGSIQNDRVDVILEKGALITVNTVVCKQLDEMKNIDYSYRHYSTDTVFWWNIWVWDISCIPQGRGRGKILSVE